MKHSKLSPVTLKNHRQLDERWVHDVIGEASSTFGLDEVGARNRERIQPDQGKYRQIWRLPKGVTLAGLEILTGS